jgi:hypothetical protein
LLVVVVTGGLSADLAWDRGLGLCQQGEIGAQKEQIRRLEERLAKLEAILGSVSGVEKVSSGQ